MAQLPSRIVLAVDFSLISSHFPSDDDLSPLFSLHFVPVSSQIFNSKGFTTCPEDPKNVGGQLELITEKLRTIRTLFATSGYPEYSSIFLCKFRIQ